MYEIFVRDAHLNRIGQITDYTQLDLIPRFNSVGSFALDIPTDSPMARELIKPKAGIIVRKDGKSLFSGTVTSRQRSFDLSGDAMTLAGVDDMACLANRLAYPVPSADFSLSDYDVRTGKAEALMKQYVDVNAGPSAISDRRTLMVEADKGLGTVVTGRARFQVLIEFLASLALSGGGLGFNVVQVGQSLEFRVYQPTDKTRSAFFSPLLGNLAEFKYSHNNPEANMVIVGGGGEGKARNLKWKQDNASIAKFGRVETFVDQRHTTDLEEINQALDEELTELAEQNSFSFTPIDTPQLSFCRDYSLGDRVSVVLTQPNEVIEIETIYHFISLYQSVSERSEKVQRIIEKLDVIQDIVREVKISITPNGDVITPTVGTEESNKSSILGIFDKQRKLEKRINHLERR